MNTKVRSSSLPTLMVCTNAVLNPDGLQVVESENPTATLGTDVHALCEGLVKTGAYDLAALKQKHTEADYDRGVIQFGNFLRLWAQAKDYMPQAQTEVYHECVLLAGSDAAKVNGVTLTGNIDCVQFDATEAYILDYKTGRTHEDHYHQMAGYAYLCWDKAGLPAAYTVYVTTVYLEDNAVHPYVFTADSLEAWAGDVLKQIGQQRYTVGRKCGVCTLQDSCPAYRAYAGNAVQVLINGVLADINDGVPIWRQLDADERGHLVDQVYVVDKALDRIRLTLRNEVKSQGAVDLGGGKEYVLTEYEEKHLDAAKAAKVLAVRLPGFRLEGEAAKLATLNLNEVLDAFAARAARGGKTTARNELFRELDAAGAVVRIKSTKMARRPKGEKTLEESK
jgi:RecB family exonuclease